jgi:hypothetical protein
VNYTNQDPAIFNYLLYMWNEIEKSCVVGVMGIDYAPNANIVDTRSNVIYLSDYLEKKSCRK